MKPLMKMQSFLRSHPFLFAFFALIISRVAGLGTVAIIQLLRPDLTIQDDLGWLLMTVYAAVAVSLVYWVNVADETGLRKPASMKEWLLTVPFLVLPLLIVAENGVRSWGLAQNLVLIIAAIGVAINEEVLFRGILLRGFMKWGHWAAIFVPSGIFAIAHSTNALFGGDVTFAVYQTIWTFAAGVALSAMRIRNKSLYPVIVCHIIMDGIEYFSTGEYGIHSNTVSLSWLQLFAALNVILAVYAVLLLYKNNKQSAHTEVTSA